MHKSLTNGLEIRGKSLSLNLSAERARLSKDKNRILPLKVEKFYIPFITDVASARHNALLPSVLC